MARVCLLQRPADHIGTGGDFLSALEVVLIAVLRLFDVVGGIAELLEFVAQVVRVFVYYVRFFGGDVVVRVRVIRVGVINNY